MAFPSTISTFNIVSPTDRLNSPSHSALHNSVSSVLTQVQTVIGVEGANSVIGSLQYLIKSPDSNGGGHVQTANKGGTGQTTYTKGDLLVATSSSVLAKLAVSSTVGDILIADSSQSAGMKWATNPNANKVAVKSSLFSLSVGQTSIAQVIFSASIMASTIGQTGGSAIQFRGEIETFSGQVGDTATFKLNYGVNSVATIVTQVIANANAIVEGAILSSTFGTQEGYIRLTGNTPSVFGFAYGNSSVESSIMQPLTITTTYSAVRNANSIAGRLFIVEKIV